MKQDISDMIAPSACLSKRQIKDYALNLLGREEQHAIEHHLSSCIFCSQALEGLHRTGAEKLDTLGADFLKDHLSLLNPRVHLNSLAPTAQTFSSKGYRRAVRGFSVRPASVFAGLILSFGVLWYLDFRNSGSLAASGSHHQAPASAHPIYIKKPAVPHIENDRMATSAQVNSPEGSVPAGVSYTRAAQPADPRPVEEDRASQSHPEKMIAVPETKPLDADHVRKKTTTSQIITEKASSKGTANSLLAVKSADVLYDAGNYRNALAGYSKKMNAGGNSDQQYAALQAARCYMSLVQPEKATALLKDLSENGSGSYKRKARRMLRRMHSEATPE